MNVGIVGLPNVGKSTIFNALTSGKAQSANYPFCTIDPNVGIVPVPDPRLKAINDILPAKEVIMTTVEIVDIAGLVKGASSGEGLGNQFLNHIAQTDAILEVVRVFEDDDITHVMGGVDPERDTETIHTELVLKDIETLTKVKERLGKRVKSGDKEAKEQSLWADKYLSSLNDNKAIRSLDLSDDEIGFIKSSGLITHKPILYIANVAEDKINDWEAEPIKKLKEIATNDNSDVILISGKIEEEISQLEGEEKKEYLESMGLEASGLDQLVHAGYRLLDLITFFTSGEKENRAWTVRKGSTAPEAAGRIHTDFERGFIRAEVISYDDFISCGGELEAKNSGKLRLEGKEYIVADGDVMHFRFNV